jgi:sugar-specific transcriptional regulator TrmB
MPVLERYLSALNLNDDQIELFLTIASDRPLTILELSSKTAIPRTTVYLYVEELVKNELLKEVTIGKKKKYEAASISRLTEIIRSKKDQYERITQDLTKSASELEMYYYASTKPKIHIVEGLDNLRKLIQEIAQEDKLHIVWSSSARKTIFPLIEYFYELLEKYMVQTKELILEDHQGINCLISWFNDINNSFMSFDLKCFLGVLI